MPKADVVRGYATFCLAVLLFAVLGVPVFSERKNTLQTGAQLSAPRPIRTESSVVVVPVFVFSREQVQRESPEVCDQLLHDVFFDTPPWQPYLPSLPQGCRLGIRGLSKKDFGVLQDGVAQTIERVSVQGSIVPVRDSETWHMEYSFAPTGIWNTPDLGAYCREHPVCYAPETFEGSYELTYVPATGEAGCHDITVKVGVSNAEVFAGKRYCIGQTPTDPLYGTTYGKRLEDDLISGKRGKIPASLRAGYFYSGTNGARVELMVEFPWNRLNHKWYNSSSALRARIGVLAVAYRHGEEEAVARSSDLLYPSYWPAFLFGWAQYGRRYRLATGFPPDPTWEQSYLQEKDPYFLPSRYETQLDLLPGNYDLQVVLSDEKEFGRTEAHLDIPDYDGKQLALSSVVLCKRYRDAHAAAVERAAANFAPQYVPLVSKGIEFSPAGDTTFRKGEDPLIAYFEIYEPFVTAQPKIEVETHVRIVSATGQVVKDFPAVDAATYIESGKTAIHIARKIPFDTLPKGKYRLEVQATDSAGRSTSWQSADFTVENEAKR